jgi:hypothetical protein
MSPDSRLALLVAVLGAASACGGGSDGPSDSGASSHLSGEAGSSMNGHDASGGEASNGDAASADALSEAGAGEGGADAPAEGGTSPSAAARQRVLAFLTGISGQKAVIGVEDKDSSNPHADSDTMASMAGNGQYPSFWSADWGFGSAVSERENIVQEGESQWAQGALIQYIYHACPPTEDESCEYSGGPAGTTDILGSSLTDAQWSDLVTPGGTLYQVWMGRLDLLATYFGELKAAGVAPLFRPFHEMNGSWAWWQGRPGPGGSSKLYQLTHDYLVGTKGLDNIVWVWNLQDYTTLAADVPQYTPGADFYDVAALDVYDTGYTTGNYQAMLTAGGGKPIGIAECEYLPTPDVLTAQPSWAIVAMWPDFFSDDTTSIPALFGDPQVMPLSQMPGWK